VARAKGAEPRPVIWIGSSRQDLKEFPESVQKGIGYALWFAQIGSKHAQVKPLRGFGGAGVLEIIEDWDGNTYQGGLHREVRRLRLRAALLPEEVETSGQDTEVRCRADHAEAACGGSRLRGKKGCRVMARKKIDVYVGSGNVFRDLGLKNPEELLAKAKLAARIVQILDERKLSQSQAAKLLGVDQPKVSQIYRGRLDDYSLERLMRFLTALHRDVRIIVDEEPRRRRGRVIVEAA
jgi:predicted XRE-type DNA-binding protein